MNDKTKATHCSQCGKPFTARACGPTHALIKHELGASQAEAPTPTPKVTKINEKEAAELWRSAEAYLGNPSDNSGARSGGAVPVHPEGIQPVRVGAAEAPKPDRIAVDWAEGSDKCVFKCPNCEQVYEVYGGLAAAPSDEQHPYHEACPKCLNTKQLLQKRLGRFEKSMDKIRQMMGLSAVHYDTPEKIADAVGTRILHWLEKSRAGEE